MSGYRRSFAKCSGRVYLQVKRTRSVARPPPRIASGRLRDNRDTHAGDCFWPAALGTANDRHQPSGCLRSLQKIGAVHPQFDPMAA